MRNVTRAVLAVTCLIVAAALIGCPPERRKDAIAVSQTSYDFGLSQQPWNLEVWNSNPTVPRLDFTVSTPTTWISCSPTSGSSTGANNRRVITLNVSRYGLAAGVHSGYIIISASGINSRRVDITLTSDGSEATAGALRVEDVSYSYTSPYLMDFTFVIQDRNRAPVIVDPAGIGVTCSEDNVPTSALESPPYLARAGAKQGAIYLVLDYTLSMAATPGAIGAMVNAVQDVLLPALDAGTLVGVYEFHRGDEEPANVCDFSTDKDFVSEQVEQIWETGGLYAGATRCWDAVYAALGEFEPTDGKDETRNLVFISDGNDTSSITTPDNIRDRANARGVRVYGIGFGDNLNMAGLQAATSSVPGRLYVALGPGDIGAGFQYVTDNLTAQYTLRWATLKRTDVEFVPSFKLDISGSTATYISPARFDVANYAGDELQGILRAVPSISDGRTTYFLRAAYVPRYIWEIWIYARSDTEFTVQKVTPDNGLCGDWLMTTEGTPLDGMWIKLANPGGIVWGEDLPFASFGPILRFDFEEEYDPGAEPFTDLYVDNTRYTGGQSFRIE